jgi:hypothetical protein
MAVHQGLLQRRIELWLGGAWVDFSSRLLTQTLSPNPGRTSGGNTVSPSTIAFSLDNPLGDLTPYRAESTYWPDIDVGMLVRYSVFWDGDWHIRGVFEATEVEPHWPYGDLSDGTTTGRPGESYVAIQAADILQRLSDNQQSLRSPLYRSMVGIAEGDYVPQAYWPMEDGADASRFASALPGGTPMSFAGSVDPSSDSDLAGSEALPTFAVGASARFTVPTYTDTDKWVIQALVKLTASAVIFDLTTDGTGRRIVVAYSSGSSTIDVDIYDASGISVYSGDTAITSDSIGVWLSVTFGLRGDTATDQFNLTYNVIGTNVFPGFGDLVSGRYGRIVGGTFMSNLVGETGAGHLAVFTDPNFDHGIDDAIHADAATGWFGETAGRRLERLFREEGIAFTSAGDLDETAPMGAQPIDTLINTARDCESTDLGILHAQRDANGLHYRTRADLYNQTPALVIDAAQNELANPFRPAATAKHIVNDVTVDRPGGSSARVIDQDSIDKVGLRARSYSANTETDDQVTQVAGWLLNLGTPDGMHYPSVSSELTIATQLIEDWLALKLGDRIQVINLPPQHPSDTVDLLVDGYTEPHSPGRWTPQINCSPAAPWDVAELDDDDLGKLDTAGCVMQAGATSGATSFTVATTVLPRWTTDAGEMPIPILVSGQVNSVTAIANVPPSFVAAGTVAHANNASVTPTMPAGVQAGDLLLVWAAIRNSGTGTVNTPSGYTVLLESGNVKLLGKVHTGTESAPQITFTGGVANADTSAQMCAFRGVGITVHDSEAQLNASAQNIATPALDVSRDNCAIVYLGWKQDDWTSVASPGTAEIGEPDTTTGDDQGIVWSYTLQTTATAVAAGTFTVTGGASAISRGAVIALATDVQTLTVTRGTNNVTKAVPIGSVVVKHRGARPAL